MADFLLFHFVCVLSNIVNAIVTPIIYRIAYQHGINLKPLIFLKFITRSTTYFALSFCSSERKDWRKLISWRALACAGITGPLGGTFPEISYAFSITFITLKLAGIASALAPLVTFILDVIRRKEKLLSRKAVLILAPTVGSAMFLGMMNEGTPLIVIQAALDRAPSPMPSTSTWSGVLLALLVCFASSTIITTSFSTLHQENMCPDLAYTFALGAFMDLFGVLTAEMCFRFQFNDLQLNTLMGKVIFISVFVSVMASVGLKWCEQQKGKSYVAAFSSLPLIIDTIAAPLALTGELHWGSFASFILMIIAICPSIWAKAKEAAVAYAVAAITVVTEDAHAAASNDQSDLAAPHRVMYKQNLLKDTTPHPQGIPCCQYDSNLNLLGQEKDSTKRLGSEQLQGDSLAITTEKASSTASNDQGAEMGDIVQTVIDVDYVVPVHNDHDNGAVRNEQLQGDSFAITMEEDSSITSNDQGIEMSHLVQTVINVNEEEPAHRVNGEKIEADHHHHDDQEIEIDDDRSIN